MFENVGEFSNFSTVVCEVCPFFVFVFCFQMKNNFAEESFPVMWLFALLGVCRCVLEVLILWSWVFSLLVYWRISLEYHMSLFCDCHLFWVLLGSQPGLWCFAFSKSQNISPTLNLLSASNISFISLKEAFSVKELFQKILIGREKYLTKVICYICMLKEM